MPVNNKLLLWAGYTAVVGNEDYEDTGGASINAGNNHHVVPANNVSSSTWSYGDLANNEGIAGGAGKAGFLVMNENFSASYLTGPHAFKFGYMEINDKEERETQFGNPSNGSSLPALSLTGADYQTLAGIGNPYVNGRYANGVSVQMECRPIAAAGTGGGATAPTPLGTPATPSSSAGFDNAMNPTFNFSNTQTYGEPTSAFDIPSYSSTTGTWTNIQIPAMAFGANPGQINATTVNSLGCPTTTINGTKFLQSYLPHRVTADIRSLLLARRGSRLAASTVKTSGGSSV